MTNAQRTCVNRRDFLSRSVQTATLASAAAVLTSGQTVAAPSRSPLKIGQIGVGHAHAKGKMEVYRASTDFDVVGVVEPDVDLRKEAEASEVYRGLKWMTQEQLLNQPGLQAVAVETQVSKLLGVAESCVAAGKHVHLDKPAGSSLPQFRRILAAADQQKLTVQMGYMYRYNPAILLLKDILKNGWLGEVFEIHAVMSKAVGTSKRKRWTASPGGTMYELGCHLIDLVVGVLGRPDGITPFNKHSAQIDDGLLDNMLSVLTYPKALATVKSTALEIEGFDRRHFVVCGTEGTMHIQPLDDPSVQLALSERHGEYGRDYQQVDVGNYKRYVADAADFARIIRGEKEADYQSEHDLTVQETVLTACGLPST